MRPIDADAFKKYIDAQEGRPFIGCTVGEAMKILIDEQPTIQPEKAQLSQEGTTKDAISRQAAIARAVPLNLFGREVMMVSVSELENLPSAQPKKQWIPCSERLPKAFEFVNCTCHSLIDDREDWVIETVYAPQPSDSPYSDWGNIPMLNSGDCKVVAWVHRDIPQPYKAESEDKE